VASSNSSVLDPEPAVQGMDTGTQVSKRQRRRWRLRRRHDGTLQAGSHGGGGFLRLEDARERRARRGERLRREREEARGLGLEVGHDLHEAEVVGAQQDRPEVHQV